MSDLRDQLFLAGLSPEQIERMVRVQEQYVQLKARELDLEEKKEMRLAAKAARE